MVDRGHKVDVVSCVPNYPSGRFFPGYSNCERRSERWEGMNIHRAWTWPRGSSKMSLIANYTTYPFTALWVALRKLKKRPDVAFVSMPSPLFQAFAGIFYRWIKGTPVVYWVQDLWPETVQYLFNIQEGFRLRVLDAICGWLYRRADIVMVQSEAMIPLIERHGVARDRIRILHNTAPPMYRPQSRAALAVLTDNVPAVPFNLIFAGNIGESQGLQTLVAAIGLLPQRCDIHATIIGSGGAEVNVKAEIARRGLEDRFTFLGRFPPERMPEFFAHADALFVSLLNLPNFALTVPYKVQCYLACGRPIVASLSGEGARLIEEAGAGVTAPAEDAKALARAIVRIADMPGEKRRKLAANARSYFERHFAEDVVYGTLERALTDAVNGHGELQS